MKTADLISLWRIEMDDAAEPYLWTEEESFDYLTDAQNEADRRARLIIDSANTETCVIDVSAGEALYPLDQRVIRVLRARPDLCSRPIPKRLTREMDAISNWETHTGSLAAYITDYQTGYIRFYRIPTVADTVLLRVHRLPLNDITWADVELEIHPRFHRSLMHWMKYRAYSKRDADTYDPNKAAEFLALFTDEFGPPNNALNEEFEERNYPMDELDGSY